MNHQKINRMVGIAVLAALVVVLQLLSSVIKIGTVSITLTLIPIVVGAAFYGPGAGAILGTVFGLVVYINSATGADYGGNMVFLANPFLCAVVCIGKGTLSGWCAGLVYRLVARKDAALGRNAVAVLLAAITAPVVNTGVFLLGMVLSYVLETPSGASRRLRAADVCALHPDGCELPRRARPQSCAEPGRFDAHPRHPQDAQLS